MDAAITDKDLIYFYFEMIKKSGALNVLDVGMFLKRIGAVSRQAMGCEIDAKVQLCGIDLYPDVQLAVYDRIYDIIFPQKLFINEIVDKNKSINFDIAVLLGIENYEEEFIQKTWKYSLDNVAAIMTEQRVADMQVIKGVITGYYPVSTGERTYAWIPTMELRGN